MQEFKLKTLFNWQLASQRIPYNIFTAYIGANIISATSGLLEVGKTYVIQSLQPGDDFSNVGFIHETLPFVATGTTPTNWTNATGVINLTDSKPLPNILQDTIGVNLALEWLDVLIPGGTNVVGLYLTFRKTNGFPENKYWAPFISDTNLEKLIIVNNSLIVTDTTVLDKGNIGQYEFRIYNT